MDIGRLHTAKNLEFSENVMLLFQPLYCPELNPAERVWQHLKRDLHWEVFEDLEQLESKLVQLLEELTPEVMAALSGYDFILDALSVAKIL
ncbi:transposase [Rubidibacter lacunae]|uniref:transposase n=1 Tax=Rubidibacter lacunae TaxID=582514 RepID=UPI0004215D9B|nr:transposase [Rubidibacter lacunae]